MSELRPSAAQQSRICGEVQRQLPAYDEGTLPRLRQRLVRLHLRRCTECKQALDREQELGRGLRSLAAADEPPPAGLLDSLLAQAASPGVKGRVAVPARGAVSGARPALSVALLVMGAAAGTGIGYAGWRGARALRRR
ncbi:MAG TPA: zf-HC2 domain-containing protein [Mycobacteriales bacterium]|nr:zf-HC2 domain-containing protein [Mycobacteriales bacterium]